MKPGLDFLCLGHKLWPVRDSIATTPQGAPGGCFDLVDEIEALPNTVANVRKHLKSGKHQEWRTHVQYRRDKKLVDIELLKKRAPIWQKVALEFPAVQLFLSHTCEYQFCSQRDVQERVNILKALAPACTPVNNPVKNAPVTDKAITERHTDDDSTGATLVSNDGFCSADIDVAAYYKNNAFASICFLWAPRFNLREVYEKNEAAPPVSQRTAIPEPGYFRTIARLLAAQGRAPKPTFKLKIVNIKQPFLYKVFAEDKKGEADPRACKPLTITNSKAPVLDIVTYTGKKIGEFGYFGTYLGGTYRHYSGWRGINLYGADIGTKAFKRSGSEFVWFVDPLTKTAYGPVNPSYRRNWFQEPK